jgi:hypothetical protein
MTKTALTPRHALRIVRGAVPALMVATVIPLAIFYSVSAVAGMKPAIVASLAWAYAMLGRQAFSTRRVSGLLMITAFTLTVRCIAWVVHQSAFTYFAVPVLETLGMGALFVVTLAIGKPLLVSLARDFVPSLGEHLGGVTYRPLVRRLSLLWGLVYAGSAASSAALLTTQSIHWFLLLHQASGWVWTGTGLALSVVYGLRHGGDLVGIATGGHRPRPAVAVAS